MSQALEVQPHGVASYWKMEQTHIHQKRQRAPSVGKRTTGELSSPRREQGLQFEQHVSKLNIARSISYLTDSEAPLLLGGQEERAGL